MRTRNVLAALGAAALIVGLTASPAAAGTGPSTWCGDGTADNEIPVLTTPITVAVEQGGASSGTHQSLRVCYSTPLPGSPAGSPAARWDWWSTSLQTSRRPAPTRRSSATRTPRSASALRATSPAA
jgi:hypothetical protein